MSNNTRLSLLHQALGLLLGMALLCLLSLSAYAEESAPGTLIPYRAIYQDQFTRVGPPPGFLTPEGRAATRATATISVTYHGFSAQAQTAFQYAVDIWSTLVTSSVPIHVDATWKVLDPGVLGSAGPKNYWRNFDGLPLFNTWYPVALANARTGVDLNGPDPEIVANFSSSFTWYFGTDGNCPAGQYDFVSVVLHELCHGIGFLGIADTLSSFGTYTYDGSTAIYDAFVVTGNDQLLITMADGSSDVAYALLSNNLYWNGPNAMQANGWARPRLYAPATWKPGSSFSHWDENTYPAGNPNSLMTPAGGSAEVTHTPGAITLGALADMGWTVATYNAQPDLYIRNAADNAYIGTNIYNLTGAGQSKSQYTGNSQTATYYVRLQNDNTASDVFRVTGTPGNGYFTIKYTNGTTGADITSAITSANGWNSPSLTPGASMWIGVYVTPTAGAPGNTSNTVTLTAISRGDLTAKDVVKATTTVLIARPDMWVSSVNVASWYIGNNIYNSDGAQQTLTLSVRPGKHYTFYYRVQNDGNDIDSYNITGYPGAPEYRVHYYEYGTNLDITSQVTSVGGWQTGVMAPGTVKIIYVVLWPDYTVHKGTTQNLPVCATSVRNPAKKDVAVILAPFVTDQPDLQVRTPGDPAYLGNNLYNTTSTGQTNTQVFDTLTGANARYDVLIQNDSDSTDNLTITGWAGGAAWNARYFYGSMDITTRVTGTGWSTGNMLPGSTILLSVTMTPDTSAGLLASQTLAITGTSVNTPSKNDVVKVVCAKKAFLADMLVRAGGTTTSYLGNNIYTGDGSNETVSQSVATGVTTTYNICIQNDSNVPDAIRVTGITGATGWHTKYVDVVTNTDITAAVTGSGWDTGTLNPGVTRNINVTLTPDATLATGANLALYISGKSAGSNYIVGDTVKCVTTVSGYFRPDAMIRLSMDHGFTGDNVYNATGLNQTRAQTTAPSTMASFLLRVQNDGTLPDVLRVKGPVSRSAWMINYYDAVTSLNITAQVTGTGWLTGTLAPGATKDLILRVTPGNAMTAGSILSVLTTVYSVGNPGNLDVVKADTTVQ